MYAAAAHSDNDADDDTVDFDGDEYADNAYDDAKVGDDDNNERDNTDADDAVDAANSRRCRRRVSYSHLSIIWCTVRAVLC